MRRSLLVGIALLLASCASDGERPPAPTPGPGSPSSTAAAPAAPPGKAVLTKVATLDKPVAMAVRRDDPAFYVAEKTGRVRKLVDGRVDPQPVVDLSSQVSQGGEQGLLGLAWSPDGRFLYVNYTDKGGDTRIVEYEGGGGAGRELLFVDQPFANHNGGNLVFGPDGKLWIGLGDGGSGGDPQGNAQDLGRLLGKMLRIDPRPSGGQPYGIPADNPFVGRPGARGEVWAFGLRNPWRYSFDRRTGDLWLGDVGQNAWEEVNVVRAGSKGGENYGWPLREGTHAFRGGERPPGAVEPVHDYSLDGGACAVAGGYVYRGARLAALLDGTYVFADTCVGRIQGLQDGKVRSLDLEVPQPVSFAEDAAGELYVLSLEGGLYRFDPVVP
ncbi:MAG TPA: PQQ-dependent sugar dehydrogenase [Acidimicrobiales bacterium]|nr:PQQ-dependent sugar dehydrogenase [Acidimicrobiales bacterium]